MKAYDKAVQCLRPTDEMERISKDDFILNFNTVLEALDKENKGIIIVNDGKDDLVLCPARWFDFCYADDFGCIVNSALRYAINRKTYMPEVVAKFICKYIPVLDKRTLIVALRDIDEALDNNEVMDAKMWLEVKKTLTARIEEIEREG